MHCKPCDVTWIGGAECWLCGDTGDRAYSGSNNFNMQQILSHLSHDYSHEVAEALSLMDPDVIANVIPPA